MSYFFVTEKRLPLAPRAFRRQMQLNRRTCAIGNLCPAPMCSLCDGVAPVCDWARAMAVISADEHFLALPKRSHKRFVPPNYEDFLKQLFGDLQTRSIKQEPQARKESARQAATSTEDALVTGTSRPPTAISPVLLE